MSSKTVNDQIVRDMFFEIRILEFENLKTKRFDDKGMVREIARIIQRHAKKEEEE